MAHQTLEALLELDRIAIMFHRNIQEDKRSAIHAAARLMEAAGAEWVITGGLAAQRYVLDPRYTRDVDLVIRAEDEARVHEALATEPFSAEFEIVHRKRTWTALVHRPSGTPVDVNSSGLFKRLLESPERLEFEGADLRFARAVWVAYTKLRTQNPRWPRKPERRVQDRADLMFLLNANPGLFGDLRGIAEPRLQAILDAVWAECQGPAVDKDLIPDTDPDLDES